MSAKRINLSTPTHTIASVPALVGFVPTESLIVLGISGPTVGVTVRIDLAGFGAQFLTTLARVLRQSDTDSVRIIIVTDSDPDTAHPFFEIVRDTLHAHRIPIAATIQTTTVATPGTRWVDHATATSGETIDYRDTLLSAEILLEGTVIAADRAAMNQWFSRDDDRQAALVDPDSIDPADTVRGIIAAMRDLSEADEDLAAALAAVIAQGKTRRDALLRTVTYDARRAADVFTHCAAMLAGRPRADVLTLAAVGYYFTGNGAHANNAIVAAHEETSQVDSLLTLIDRALSAGLPPTVIKEALSSLISHDRASELLGADYPPYQ